ncbi:GNAT family N-acetyltransferase [Terrimonas rubra]|uniref:GNAT family N-acetyltransferase n=1 Tax=Terrimonas rubra TaxID=1035890 RepID=A0ABW6A3C1_9BACT
MDTDILAIREVQPGDNKALAGLIRTVFEEHDAPRQNTVYSDPTTDKLYELFDQPEAILWVAVLNNTIVGCAGVYPTEDLPPGHAELVKIYLSAQSRGRGIGKALIGKCFQSAKELGYTHLYLESMPEFATAVSMYHKLGFRDLPAAMGSSGHTACNIWMIKEL